MTGFASLSGVIKLIVGEGLA